MTRCLLYPGLRSRWHFTTLWENVCLQWSKGTSLTFSHRLCKLCACLVSLWCATGGFTFTLSASGWTVGTTSVTGDLINRIAHSPCLRSELNHRVRSSGPNPSKLVPLSISTVRRSTVSTQTQNKFDSICGIYSNLKVQNWCDRYTLLFSLATRSMLTLAEGYRHHFSMP